jgi:S-adenosylmethionine hydrolase
MLNPGYHGRLIFSPCGAFFDEKISIDSASRPNGSGLPLPAQS